MTGQSALQRLQDAVGWVAGPAGGPESRPTRRSLIFDTVLAVLIAAASTVYVLEVLHTPPVAHPIGHPVQSTDLSTLLALAIVSSLALAWRRRFPLSVLLVVITTAVLTPYNAARITFYPAVLAAYSAAAYSSRRMPKLIALAAAVAVFGFMRNDGLTPAVPDQYAPLLISVPLVVAAMGLRAWKLRVDESQTELSALERARSEELRHAVEQERLRIARELHDIVTHHVSVMVIQAGAARKIIRTAPDDAEDALLTVEAGGRAAMDELRHVMGLLTTDAGSSASDDDAELAPQPGLGEVAALLDRLRATGVAVELAEIGLSREVPDGVGLAAYRVVQEAMTNIVKHASGATATVTVEYGDHLLCVEVVDTGGVAGPSAASGNGRGLIGLKGRLEMYGGSLQAGPRPLGGYRVKAMLPLEVR
ncbi:sensor histidine kinase [Polymorphospora rubra]|uniref:histidine kinase n=1 Tax=Polymorphospora rubra TaxID=338584 RepID=A0A810NCA3_9ACTN|nr:histidine kinase [Polymorphospora rubra]BCJ69488.1 ATPase [Polymorphospora rubra]